MGEARERVEVLILPHGSAEVVLSSILSYWQKTKTF